MQTRYFIFLEFTDPKVRDFLDALRIALTASIPTDSPHITVRGPYIAKPERTALEEWRQDLSGHGVFLIDPGVFRTPKGYAVYLHAKSNIFDKIWWKPDYRGPKSSRKPHVTLFETKNSYAAKMVKNFLETEQISIFTYGVDLTVYTSKQHQLMESGYEYLNPSYRQLPPERINANDGVIARAKQLQLHIAQQEDSPPFQPLLF